MQIKTQVYKLSMKMTVNRYPSETLRQQQVLIGRSGPLKNSLKLRPSLVFQPEHVDIFIAALDKSLSQLSA